MRRIFHPHWLQFVWLWSTTFISPSALAHKDCIEKLLRVEIRRASSLDFQKIRQLNRSLHLGGKGAYWSSRNYIKEAIRAGEFWVAYAPEGVVGALCLVEGREEMRIDTVAADPAVKNRGVGSALVNFAKARAKEMGFNLLRVHSFREYEVTGFYLKLGFRLVGSPTDHTLEFIAEL